MLMVETVVHWASTLVPSLVTPTTATRAISAAIIAYSSEVTARLSLRRWKTTDGRLRILLDLQSRAEVAGASMTAAMAHILSTRC